MSSRVIHLPPEALSKLLKIVEPTKAVVIGGQAISIWAEHYRGRIDNLFDRGPLTSKDLDFYHNEEAIKSLARELRGKVYRPSMDDASPQSAKVVAIVMDTEISIDFLASVAGCDELEMASRSVKLVGGAYGGRSIHISVMHPLDCMRSRIGNINTIHRTEQHSINQALASIKILHQFLLDILENERISRQERTRHVQDVLMELAKYIKQAHKGKPSHMQKEFGLNPEEILAAFIDNPRLDARWREKILLRSHERTVDSLQRIYEHLIKFRARGPQAQKSG